MNGRSFECDVRGAFNFIPAAHRTVGHLSRMRVNGRDFSADLNVTNPLTPTESLDVVAVINSIVWQKSSPDSLEIVGRISGENTSLLQETLTDIVQRTKIAAEFAIYRYHTKKGEYYPVFFTQRLTHFHILNGTIPYLAEEPCTDIQKPINFAFEMSLSFDSDRVPQDLGLGQFDSDIVTRRPPEEPLYKLGCLDLANLPSLVLRLGLTVCKNFKHSEAFFLDMAKAFEKDPWKLEWILFSTEVPLHPEWENPKHQDSFPQCRAILARWRAVSALNKLRMADHFSMIRKAVAEKKWREAMHLFAQIKRAYDQMEVPFDSATCSIEEVKKWGQNFKALRASFPFNALFDDDQLEKIILHGRVSDVLVAQAEALKRFEELESLFKITLLTPLVAPPTESVAEDWKSWEDYRIIFALFDKRGSIHLQKAIQSQMISEEGIMNLKKKVDALLAPTSPLSAEERRIVASFEQSFSAGGRTCHLGNQFNQASFSDLTLQLGTEKMAVHRLFLSLDPYFDNFLQSSDSIILIPQESNQEVKNRLKSIYGTYSWQDLVSTDKERVFRKYQTQPLSFFSW